MEAILKKKVGKEQPKPQPKPVLLHDKKKAHQDTVRRRYLKFRKMNGVPERCDNPKCRFHTDDLIWNGAALKMVLDHIEGNRYDNAFFNLRFLCPNCDSQLKTRGGGSKGRIKYLDDYAYEIHERDGEITLVVIPTTQHENLVTLDEDEKKEWLKILTKGLRPLKQSKK